MCREYHALNVSGFGVTPFGVEGSFSTKTAHEKDNGWEAGGVGGRWRRDSPVVDSRDNGQTIMYREYHALNASSFGVTPFGVEGSFSTKTAHEKDNGWETGGVGGRSRRDSPVEDSRNTFPQISWTESITR